MDQGGEKGRASEDVGKPLRSNFAKWALKGIGKRVRKPGASGPSVGKSPNNKTSKKRGVAPTENDENITNVVQGNLIGEVFMQPPRSPHKEEVGKGERV